MNYRLKHHGAYQLTPNYHPVDGAPRTSHDLPGFSNHKEREFEATIIPVSGVSDPSLASRPAFYQHQPVSFTSLSDRIANQGQGQTVSLEADAFFEPNDQRFNTVREAVRAAWLNPQSLALTSLLAVLVGFFVYRFVTG